MGPNPNFIQNAIQKPGAMTAAAQNAGQTNNQYEQAHQQDPGLAGKRARLAMILKGLHHGAK